VFKHKLVLMLVCHAQDTLLLKDHTTLLFSRYTTPLLRVFPHPIFEHQHYQSHTVGWVMLG